MTSKEGDKVTIHYTAKAKDGQVIESTHGKEPSTLQVGSGKAMQGLDEALLGVEKGERKTVTIPPNKGFGERKEELIQEVPRNIVKEDVKGAEGKMLELKLKDGSQRLATIKEVKEDKIVLDFNHPLAGETLTLDIEVLDIK
jgi:FKBP-type peptidyl-prolyl cis-trans isomerase 2